MRWGVLYSMRGPINLHKRTHRRSTKANLTSHHHHQNPSCLTMSEGVHLIIILALIVRTLLRHWNLLGSLPGSLPDAPGPWGPKNVESKYTRGQKNTWLPYPVKKVYAGITNGVKRNAENKHRCKLKINTDGNHKNEKSQTWEHHKLTIYQNGKSPEWEIALLWIS